MRAGGRFEGSNSGWILPPGEADRESGWASFGEQYNNSGRNAHMFNIASVVNKNWIWFPHDTNSTSVNSWKVCQKSEIWSVILKDFENNLKYYSVAGNLKDDHIRWCMNQFQKEGIFSDHFGNDFRYFVLVWGLKIQLWKYIYFPTECSQIILKLIGSVFGLNWLNHKS